MKNILVFCSRDWRHPKAGFVERYAHKVFSRIAAQGNYVGWVCQNRLFPFSPASRRPQIELLDGIQVARLAPGILYRTMAQMFLTRLEKRKNLTRRMDAIVDCVVGEPLPLSNATAVPIIPLVFNLSKRMRANDSPPGPVIAATTKARTQLAQAGFPQNFLVQAPAGVDIDVPPMQPADAQLPPIIVAIDDNHRQFKSALSSVQSGGLNISASLVAVKRVSESDRANLYGRAQIGYCGHGAEEEALAFAAHGVPVICPDTDAAREFVIHGETGLFYAPGDTRALAECIRKLAKDELLRKRMAANARQSAEARSWDRTAGLILATIENLENTGG
ncbi:MAG: glycosyltransferase [Candidatus Hydrogenedentes bacterium]|nr:glycosyltransferase [Candidatus Hydrogenedentota bacterium]